MKADRPRDPSPSKIPPHGTPNIPVIVEEDSQEESRDESEIEISQSSKVKKVGRRSNQNKRDKEANRDKELGIQVTLEEVYRKDRKGGKAPSTKGHNSSQPTKGGAPKFISK